MRRETSFDRANPIHLSSLVSIWNDAGGADLAINSRLAEYNTRPATGVAQSGRIARRDERAVGFALASALPNDPATSPPQTGWIDTIVVARDFQRRGIGSALLAWAEDWLREQGCTYARLGGSLRPFAPGLPAELGAENFFRAHGYISRSEGANVWDDGFVHLTLEDSVNPIERVYMHRLPRPWGQLGPIGVSRDMRDKGFGAVLLDAALRHLREHGVRGCVIDWTNLLDFYAQFGFKPFRKYLVLVKDIGGR